MVQHLGPVQFFQVTPHSHNWGDSYNKHLIQMSVLAHGAAESRTTAIPATGTDKQILIDPATDRVYAWYDGEWYTLDPVPGMQLFIRDTQEIALFDETSQWVTALSLPLPDKAVPRELSFHAPGDLRDNSAVFFRYAASMEFTVLAGAPSSSAFLDTAPSADVVFSMKRNGQEVGTITFLSGSTEGTFAVPGDFSVMPTAVEGAYARAQEFLITGPVSVAGAQGLTVTLAGVERALV
ncbi:hypothetical protein Q669_29475 [Labrenzia sp. C1B10]|uniref:DUF2793 domain-containing protein n=1 Tax=unclassified Labrenzia TaxID=2648686 RepID=UPI0003B8E8F7|nr:MULTISPECIES: DUF2793 domain-containing protein [unclassified Labrenzia]ERP95701.1 hypothetical protein Q669_29475 [Labrenzia sp. C1B10]ERS05767.1 hypothetical protein Q675_29040 [Labrenzia sp. C1B70]